MVLSRTQAGYAFEKSSCHHHKNPVFRRKQPDFRRFVWYIKHLLAVPLVDNLLPLGFYHGAFTAEE